MSAPSSMSLEITDVSSGLSLEILGHIVACSSKGQRFAYDHFFKPKRIQFTNKSVLHLSLRRSVSSLQAPAMPVHQ